MKAQATPPANPFVSAREQFERIVRISGKRAELLDDSRRSRRRPPGGGLRVAQAVCTRGTSMPEAPAK